MRERYIRVDFMAPESLIAEVDKIATVRLISRADLIRQLLLKLTTQELYSNNKKREDNS